MPLCKSPHHNLVSYFLPVEHLFRPSSLLIESSMNSSRRRLYCRLPIFKEALEKQPKSWKCHKFSAANRTNNTLHTITHPMSIKQVKEFFLAADWEVRLFWRRFSLLILMLLQSGSKELFRGRKNQRPVEYCQNQICRLSTSTAAATLLPVSSHKHLHHQQL